MKTVKEIKKGLPKGMVKVGEECERAIVRLVKQGQTQEQATNTVYRYTVNFSYTLQGSNL